MKPMVFTQLGPPSFHLLNIINVKLIMFSKLLQPHCTLVLPAASSLVCLTFTLPTSSSLQPHLMYFIFLPALMLKLHENVDLASIKHGYE